MPQLHLEMTEIHQVQRLLENNVFREDTCWSFVERWRLDEILTAS